MKLDLSEKGFPLTADYVTQHKFTTIFRDEKIFMLQNRGVITHVSILYHVQSACYDIV